MPASLDAWDAQLRSMFGLSLASHPARLRDGLRAACTYIGVADDADLLLQLERGDENARAAVARALTIGETYFFREPHHFDLLREELLPAAVSRARGPVVMVSAACSSGEEAYSMAVTARQVLGASVNGAIRVVGFDVNEQAIVSARRGLYRAWAMRGMTEAVRQRWFEPADGGAWSVTALVRSLLTFERRNLVDTTEALPKGSVDIVFCRNVLIYFDEPSVVLVLRRLAESLRPHGSLVVSSAEGALFALAGLPSREMRGAWVHTRGETPAADAPVTRKRATPLPPERRPVERRKRSGPPAATPIVATPPAHAGADIAACLDQGWAILASSPVAAAEEARRAILLDRTMPAAHLLAASAALAQEDVHGARRALRHARRYLGAQPADEILRGSGGATAAQMVSYCARLERALEGRDG